MIEVSSASDIGRVRTSNEDSYGVFSPAVYVVADGLGGHAAGEIASRMVVAAVHDMVNSGGEIDAAALQSAVLRANQRVLDASAENPSYEGMGSTATVLHIDEKDGLAYYAHVGDSRLYLLRRGIFQQVSRDHSYVEELVARGELSEAEAQHHPRKNLLLRAVGIEESLHVDGDSFSIEDGDRLLLATDGLTNMVEDAALAALLGSSFEGVADRMVEQALAEGGRDNVTAIALAYQAS
jgi:2C family serine/threonine protein phosphatase